MNESKESPPESDKPVIHDNTNAEEVNAGNFGAAPKSGSVPDFAAMTAKPIITGAIGKASGEGRKKGEPKTDAEKEESRKKRLTRKEQKDKELLSFATAETVVGGLDSVRDIFAGGQCPQNVQMREATVQAWARYCRETGKEIPPSVMVMVMSTMYVGQSFKTETGSRFFVGLWGKVKGVWAFRKKSTIQNG